MKTTPVSLIFTSIVFFPGLLLAESQPGKPKGERGQSIHAMWERLDANNDGALQFAEFQNLPRLARLSEEKQRSIFERFDKNSDGNLTREEHRIAQREQGQERRRRLMELDTNGSGGVCIDEFRKGEMLAKIAPERVEIMFRNMDVDGDGEITPRDRPEIPNKHRDPQKPRADRPEMLRKMFDRMDADQSGSLDFEQFRKGRGVSAMDEDTQEALFLRLDTDQDKQLSFEEFSKANLRELAPSPRHKGPQKRKEKTE